MKPIFIGRSDFASLREDGGLYVDKSLFISEVLARSPTIQLYPRPRRFGKTLNLSMLRYFLERGPDRSALFSDLQVWQDPNARKHFGRYPVIYLTFKDVKQLRWTEAKPMLHAIVAAELLRLAPIWDVPDVDALLRQKLQAVMEERAESLRVLLDLSKALAQATQQRVILLIDEYDAPLLTAWQHGYFDDAADWFRTFFTAGLKDNPHAFKGVLTGILRVAKESMFSGLNNIHVYSLLARQSECFGFTEPDVQALLTEYGRELQAEEIRIWYNGYRFGETTVYNPWSILTMLNSPQEPLQPWWLNTSDNALVKELLLGRTELSPDIESLLKGIAIEREINEDVPLRDLRGNHVWGLLLFSGYLKAVAVRVEEGVCYVTLALPNLEVRQVWKTTFLGWLKDGLPRLEPLHQALLTGDAATLELILSDLLVAHVSLHDVKTGQDEVFYHAFVLGLLVSMEKTHLVRSNREVGYGRSDVLIFPRRPGDSGVVLEFKKRKARRTLSSMAAEALKQIDTNHYAADLEAAGVSPIRKFGIAFAGKRVSVKGG